MDYNQNFNTYDLKIPIFTSKTTMAIFLMKKLIEIPNKIIIININTTNN